MRYYQAKSHSKSIRATLKEMFTNLRHNNYVGFRLFVKDIRAEYSRMLGGVLWDFVEPLAFVAVFVFLRHSQTLTVNAMNMPYALFITIGMLLWQIFNDSVRMPLSALQRSRSILKNMNIPAETILFSTCYKIIFNALFSVAVIAVVSLYYGVFSIKGLLLLPIFSCFLIIVGASIGFLLAPLNVVYGDINKVVTIILRPLMFISGTIFPIPTDGFYSFLYLINPVLIVIEGLRGLVTLGTIPLSLLFWGNVMFWVVLFLLAWYFFHVAFRLASDKL